MTTKPKARKFRIKRTPPRPSLSNGPGSGSGADGVQAQPGAAEPTQSSATPQGAPATGPGAAPLQGGGEPARSGATDSAATVAAETDIDTIRREGLTGRQLRMARRVAQKHGLAPTSDFDAVRLLRAKGIDPFQRSNMLELVVPDPQTGGP